MWLSKRLRLDGILLTIVILVCLKFSFQSVSNMLKLPITEEQIYENILWDISNHLQELWNNLVLQGSKIDLLTFAQIQDIHKQILGELKQNLGNRTFDSDEKLRRNLEVLVKELWFTIVGQKPFLDSYVFGILEDNSRTIKADLIKLRAHDGYEAFRAKELGKLSNLVQNQLNALQNLIDCESAPKMYTQFGGECGFGCCMHQAYFAFITAFALGRTLIWDATDWRYKRIAWSEVFLPVSNSCEFSSMNLPVDLESNYTEADEIVIWKSVKYSPPTSKYRQMIIPSEIADQLERFHGEPQIWWVGQFLSYLFKLRPEIQSIVDNKTSRWGACPYVGVHIRRTDKLIRESQYYDLEEYMVHVEDYFAIMDKVGYPFDCGSTRRVFIATDDPGAIDEARQKYPTPQWDILGDLVVAEFAQDHRASSTSLIGTITDLFTLAKSNFLLCRAAYEIMQSIKGDASGHAISLDISWGLTRHNQPTRQIVVMEHQPMSNLEVELQVGDEIQCEQNFLNGTSKGTNSRSRKKGMYPSYKTRSQPMRVNFPNVEWPHDYL